MAVVATIEETFSLGGTGYLYRGSLALDNSYAGAAGEPIDPTGNSRLDNFLILPGSTAATGLGLRGEWDASNQALHILKGNLSGTVTVNPASLATDAIANTDVTVTGLATTDVVTVIPPITLEAGLVVQSAVVSSADTLRIRVSNTSAGTVDAASATWTWVVQGTREVLAGTDLSAATAVPFIGIGQ